MPSSTADMCLHPLFESLCDLRLNCVRSTCRSEHGGVLGFVRGEIAEILGELTLTLLSMVKLPLTSLPSSVRQLGAHGAIGIIERPARGARW